MIGSQKVQFGKVPGNFVSYTQLKITAPDSSKLSQAENTANVMTYKRAVVKTDEEGKEGAFMPAVPAL